MFLFSLFLDTTPFNMYTVGMCTDQKRKNRKKCAQSLRFRSILRVLRSIFQTWRGQVHIRQQQRKKAIIRRRTVGFEKVFKSLQSQRTPYTVETVCFYRWNRHVREKKQRKNFLLRSLLFQITQTARFNLLTSWRVWYFFKIVDVAFIVRLRNNNSECRRVHTAGRRQEEIATEQTRHAEARLGRMNECLHRAAARLLLSTLLRRTIVQKQAAFSTLKCYSLLDTHVSRLRWSAARRTLQRRRARCLRHSFSHWRQTCFKTMMRQLVLGTKLLSVRMQRVHARTSMHHRWRTWCHYVRTLASRSRILLTLSRRIARRNMTCAWTRWVRWLIHNNAEKLLQRGRQDAKLQSLSLRHNHQKLAERLASIFENKLYSSGTSILVRVIRRYCIRNAFRQWAKEAQMNARTEHVLSKLLCLWNRKRISIFLRRWMTATRQVRRN